MGTTPQDVVTDTTGSSADDETPSSQGVARVARWARALRPAWKAFAAYFLYQTLAIVIWVLPILPRFAHQHIGTGLFDARYYQWALTWTPWAIGHGVDPLHTSQVFSPVGVSLAWSAFVPGPAIALWPVTATFGPLASLNLLLAISPALAGWAAYLVCVRVTDRYWPSVLGGCLFGFSSYMAGNMIGFANLVPVFPIPLLVYLTIRRVEGSLGRVAFVAGFAASLIALFSVSTELFGSATVFGAIAYALALLAGSDIRRRLLDTALLVLFAGGIAAGVLAPYLRDVLVQPSAGQRLGSADLVSFVVPSTHTRLGGTAFASYMTHLGAHLANRGLSYIGITGLALLIGFGITERRRRGTWPLLAFVATVMLLSLGPNLFVGGHRVVPLPGELLVHAPLIQSASPDRFALYLSLTLAVIAAIWLARSGGRSWLRWTLAIVVAVTVLPKPPGGPPPPQIVPAFLSSSTMRQVLHQSEIVYAIPMLKGDEMLWQATSGFWFDLAQGYIGPIPPELDTGRLAHGVSLRRKTLFIPPSREFRTWIAEHGVTAVLVDHKALSTYSSMLDEAGLTSVYSGEGVSVWRWTSGPPPSPASS